MTKATVFTLKLEAELRDAFMAATEAEHRPASQVVRDLMREYVRSRQQRQAYEAFVQEKVDIARAQIAEGRHTSNEEVAAEFAARRDAVRQRLGSGK
jgi:predicted transcriptional regulator